MDFHRPSILHRPLRSGSQATKETADEQWQREQALLQRKAAAQQEHINRLTRSLYPTEDSKAAMAREQQQQLAAAQAARAQAQAMERKMEEEQERAWADPSRRGVASPRSDQPWHNASMYYSSEQEERAARRRYEEQVGIANMLAAKERAYAQQRQKAEEEEAARKLLAEESCFWNLGANSERWIAPERRLHSPPGPRHPASAPQHPPVWSWASDEVAKSYVPPPQQGIRSPRQPQVQQRPTTPWALDEEPAQSAAPPPVSQRFQSRPASAASKAPWATDDDTTAPPPPIHGGRKHVLPSQQKDGFGARVERPFPF